MAHYDWHWQRTLGIHDGDAVAPCAPCDRLRAGFWCAECGAGFARDHDDTEEFGAPYARVEWSLDGAGTRYLEDDRPFSYHRAAATPAEERALQQQIDDLPVGTVVERFGSGVAPRFRERQVEPVRSEGAR